MKHHDFHAVTLSPSGKCIEIPHGTLLSDALLDLGIPMETPCGGRGTCRKCRIEVEGQGPVLACQELVTRDITVRAEMPGAPISIPVSGMEPGDRFALAVDIGTTTVRMSFIDVSRKACFGIASFLNPQRRFGHDVISRIAAGPSGRSAMTGLMRKAIDLRVKNALEAADIPADRVEKVVLSGNTTMLHLLFGLDVDPLGRYPYQAHTRNFEGMTAEGIGLHSIPRAEVTALPVVSAFIGADLVGGLSLAFEQDFRGNVFFIDLGTNGELFVFNEAGEIFAASCAMGPALEGMNIAWGMTASPGAITHVEENAGSLGYTMIGQGDPSGMTGTALVDLLAILLDKGVIKQGGTFASGLNEVGFSLNETREAKSIKLWGEICLTQKDIRNVQLAKAASLSASRFLLEAAGADPKEVEHVLIAGAFGEHLDLKRFERLGFIPSFPNARHEFLGNTSLKAAETACMDPGFLARATALRDRTREVMLSALPGFQDAFIQSLNFPAARCTS